MPHPMTTSEAGWLANAIDEIATAAIASSEGKTPPIAIDPDTKQALPGVLPYAVVPTTHKIESLERYVYNEYSPRPHRLKQHVALSSLDSFCSYVAKFKDERTAVFADLDEFKFTAILDYHGSPAEPSWKSHTASFTLQKSPELQVWTSKNKNAFDQQAFAEFIEANSADIIRPAAATLIEKALIFQSTSEVKFTSIKNLGNGNTTFMYSSQESGNGTGTFPNELVLRIELFEGGGLRDFTALLRYRIENGKLKIFYELLSVERQMRAAFREIFKSLESRVSAPVYLGDAPQ